MTSLTDRYLEAALRGVPGQKRSDLEQELRSSIADAIDDRTAAGEDPARAETDVLEGLGDPGILASRLTGRPMWIVGPDVYPLWRHLMLMLVPIALAVVAVIQAVLAIADQATVGQIVLQSAGGAIMVGVQITFWVTLVFALWERVASAEEVRASLGMATGRWTIDRLPVPTSGRMSPGDLVGELFMDILTVVGLLVLTQIHIVRDGVQVALLAADFRDVWVPVLVAVLVALAILQLVVYAKGRWTIRLATLNAVLGIAFAAPVVVLALRGQILDPAFGAAIGWPEVGAADGVTMLIVAISVILVTGWDVVATYRKAYAASARRATPAP